MGEHVAYERYNPISMVPADRGWKAVYEVCDANAKLVGVAEEDVVVWAICEHTTQCKCTEPHVERHDNFACGLVSNEFAEGGLQPALAREGLLGYRSPVETIEAFIERMGIAIDDEPEDYSPSNGGRVEPAKALN